MPPLVIPESGMDDDQMTTTNDQDLLRGADLHSRPDAASTMDSV